jgi:SAM-dependent methyltransferase
MAPDDLAVHYSPGLETTRLTRSAHGRLEFVRTQELLRRLLPAPPARVLDVGGATGVHASWLARDGYRVHVVDPVAHHVEAAAALDEVTAEVGDARHLSAATESVDAVLLLGPLYHLAAVEDRVTALLEARRVLRAGGVLVAAAISRYLSLLEVGTNGQLTEDLIRPVAEVIETGAYDGHVGFVDGHWHTADELRDEVRSCGFGDVEVYGVEGPAWPTLDAIGDQSFDVAQDAAVRCARLVERDPLMLHASAHFLAVATLVPQRP